MEFGRRLAAERDLEKSDSFNYCNISRSLNIRSYSIFVHSCVHFCELLSILNLLCVCYNNITCSAFPKCIRMTPAIHNLK